MSHIKSVFQHTPLTKEVYTRVWAELIAALECRKGSA